MPGKARRFWSQFADAFIPGNAYNEVTGRWNPATTQTGIAGIIAGQVIPGGEQLTGLAAQHGLFGNELATRLRNEGIYNDISQQYGQTKTELADWLRNQQVEIGGNPQVTVGQPQVVNGGGNIPTLPPVNTTAPWEGLGTSTGGLFGGGQLGNWANGGGGGNASRPIGGALSFGGGPGGYNNGVGAGTGFGGASYTNDGWGETAMGFGVGGMAGGSRDQAMSSEGPTGRKQRR